MKKKFTVLHVDDDMVALEFSKRALKSDSINLYTTTDTNEAQVIFHEKKPDIVILDICMPERDGLDLAKEFKNLNKDLKVIIMSCHDEKEKLLDAIEIKVDKYLIKPVVVQNLKSAVFKIILELTQDGSPANLLFIKYGYVWDKDTKRLLKDEIEVKLTPKELAFISLLAQNPNKIFSNEDILNSIWDEEFAEEQKTGKIRGLLDRLKNKLDGAKIFQSNYGRGYKLKLEK